MIETEKRTGEIEEFSPTEPLYQENVIRHLVRLTSFIIIVLLGVSVFRNALPDFEFYTTLLIFALMPVFLVGIFLAFFQLRWVNEKRNKSTNLGGMVGFFGLFAIFLCSISSLKVIFIPPVILIPLLGFGLFLIVIGFFAETTRIDEPLVFWFRVNLEVIIRYTISILGVFLVNWSLLSIFVLFLVEWDVLAIFAFPGDFIGGLIINIIGWGLIWGSWFRQINETIWRYRIEIIRTIELNFGLGLILSVIILPFMNPNFFFLSFIFGVIGLVLFYLDLYIFKVKVTSHFSKRYVTISQVFVTLIGLIMIIIGLIQTQSTPEWFFFSIYSPVIGLLLLYRIWFDNINNSIKRTIQATILFFRTYYREIITTFGVCFMALGTFLFEFTKLANPFLMDALQIDSFFDPLPIGLILGGFGLATIIWHIPNRHDYFRGVTTTLSFTVVLWGILLLGLLLTPPVSSDELSFVIASFMIFIAIFADGVLWRTEIYYSVKKLFITIKDTLIYTGQAIFHFVKRVLYAIWDHHVAIIRTITTTTGAIFLLAGLFPITQLNVLTIRLALILGGLLLLYTTWFYHVNSLIKQSAVVTWNALVRTGHTLYDFLGRVKNGVIAALHTIWVYRIVILRVMATVLGPLMILSVAVVPVLGFPPEAVVLIQIILFVAGIGILYSAWFYQVNHLIKHSAVATWNALVRTGHTLYDFLRRVKNGVFAAFHSIWFYRIVILRVVATVLGPLMILSVAVVPLLNVFPDQLELGIQLVLLIGGASLLYSAWFRQVNHFVKQASITIWNTLVQTAHSLYNFLRRVKNRVIEGLHTIWLYRIVILRVIATILGPLMILSVAIVPVFGFTSEIVVLIQVMFFIVGFGILYSAWFHQVNHFVKQTASILKNFSITVKDALLQVTRSFIEFIDNLFHKIWEHRINIIRAMVTISGSILLSIGLLSLYYYVWFREFLLVGFFEFYLITIGLFLLYLAWFRVVTNSIASFFRYTWDHRVDILRAVTTISGSILVLVGLFPPSPVLFDYRLILIPCGLVFIYFAWLHQVNQAVKHLGIAIRDAIAQIATAVYALLVSVINSMITFFHYTWDHRIDILRAITTITGSILLLAGLFPPSRELFDFRAVLIIIGVIFLYLAWFRHVNDFIKQSAIAIHAALQKALDAIIQAFRAFFQYLRDVYHKIVQFFQTYYIEIIRYFTTCVGLILLIVGLIRLYDPSGWLLLGGGLIILYAAWVHQVNRIIIQILRAIWNGIVQTAYAFQNFLIRVKNVLRRVFLALGGFMRKVALQLNQLLHTTVDLIIPIILILLALSVSIYGVIVLLSGLVDPSGVSISNSFLAIPILGAILEFFASIIQWGTYERNLLGFFPRSSAFLIPLGAALIVVGVVLFLFVALKKEKMRLHTLRDSSKDINADRGGK
ncbi:MAG: hypothetical protein ACFFDT_11285 [Candidatus Hodarchaeota archaeon]